MQPLVTMRGIPNLVIAILISAAAHAGSRASGASARLRFYRGVLLMRWIGLRVDSTCFFGIWPRHPGDGPARMRASWGGCRTGCARKTNRNSLEKGLFTVREQGTVNQN